jgi:hypothetical protein
MKTVRIKNIAIATDIQVCEIYHTNITGSNLLTTSVSSSGQFTGDDLAKGLEFQVEDNISQFYVKNIERCVNIGSGSLTENTSLIQFIHVDPNNFGPVEINGENQTVSSTPQTVRHNFSLYPTITLIANPVYPLQFDSWHIAEPMTSANKISNSSKLTISSGSFNSATSFYVNAS